MKNTHEKTMERRTEARKKEKTVLVKPFEAKELTMMRNN